MIYPLCPTLWGTLWSLKNIFKYLNGHSHKNTYKSYKSKSCGNSELSLGPQVRLSNRTQINDSNVFPKTTTLTSIFKINSELKQIPNCIPRFLLTVYIITAYIIVRMETQWALAASGVASIFLDKNNHDSIWSVG